MIKAIKRFTALTFFFLLGLVTTNAFGNEYDHVDRLALSIQRSARELLSETVHYRHTCNYRHMVADCAELARLGAHIHDLVHHEVNIDHVEADLAELDRTFHHVEELFDATEIAASRGRGQIVGNTAHVKELLECIEDDIHHLQEDVAKIRRRMRNNVVLAPVVVNRAPYIDRRTEVRTNGRVRVVTETVVTRGGIYGGSIYGAPTTPAFGHAGHNHGRYGQPVGGIGGGGVNVQLIGNSGRGRGNGNAYGRGHNDRHDHGHGRSQSRQFSRPGFTIGGGSSKIRINF